MPAEAVCWAVDPTGAHAERPVVVLSHETHPHGATECAVMCLGTTVSQFQHPTPPLEPGHYDGISFAEPPQLLPWALRTIAPGTFATERPIGQLTDDGERADKKSLVALFAI